MSKTPPNSDTSSLNLFAGAIAAYFLHRDIETIAKTADLLQAAPPIPVAMTDTNRIGCQLEILALQIAMHVKE